MPLLDVKNLTAKIRIGKKVATVVDHLSFSLEEGQTLGLVGESGCGKSMTALSLLKLLPNPPCLPPEGEVWFKGDNLLKLSGRALRKVRGKEIAMIFQNSMSALNPVYTVGQQLLEVAEDLDQVIHALGDVGIPSPEKRMQEYPHQLSGGLKQRVMIAMALMCQPDILIADEPTTALDVTIQAQILDLMRGLQEKNGMAILFITHDMGVIAEMADDVIVMYASQAVEKGSVTDLFDQMAHPYTQGLFNSRPQSGKALTPIPGSVPSVTHFPSGCHFHPRCPHVMPKCREKSVPVFGDEHQSKCWLQEDWE